MSRAEFTIEEVKSVFTPKAVIEAGYNVKPELAGRLEWPAAATLEAEEGFTIIELKEAGARIRGREFTSHFTLYSNRLHGGGREGSGCVSTRPCAYEVLTLSAYAGFTATEARECGLISSIQDASNAGAHSNVRAWLQ